MEHKDIGLEQIHGIVNYVYETLGELQSTTFTASDEYKVAAVVESEKQYIFLKNSHGEFYWKELGGQPPRPVTKFTDVDLEVYSWHPNSDTTTGSSVDDFGSFGTGVYNPIGHTPNAAKTGLFGMSSHAFTSAASSYSSAGVASANPVMVMPSFPTNDTYTFECIMANTYAELTVGAFGLYASRGQATGNFSGSDVGIGLGWNAREGTGNEIMKMAGSGTEITIEPINGLDVQLPTVDGNQTTALKIIIGFSEEFNGYGAEFQISTIEGKLVYTGYIPPVLLPPAGTPLYAVTAVGTGGASASVGVNLVRASFIRNVFKGEIQ